MVKNVPNVTVAFGMPRIDGTEVPISEVIAVCPPESVNVASVSSDGRHVIVAVDPQSLEAQPETGSLQYHITLEGVGP